MLVNKGNKTTIRQATANSENLNPKSTENASPKALGSPSSFQFPGSATLKKKEINFDRMMSKKITMEPVQMEPRSMEAVDLLSSKIDKGDRIPKLVPYKMEDLADYDYWNNIINQLSKNNSTNNVNTVNTVNNNNINDQRAKTLNDLSNRNKDQEKYQSNQYIKTEPTPTPNLLLPSRMQSPVLGSGPNPELNISIHHSQSDERSEAQELNLNQVVAELKNTPIDLLENVRDLEKTHKIKVLNEKVVQLKKEKEELIGKVNQLNTMLIMLAKKQQERETHLLDEIQYLKEYAAKNSEEKFESLEKENKRLKQELEAAKQELIEMEEQRKNENEELIHLYVDIEETKKNIIEQLVQIKFSKEKLNQERKELEVERKEIIRYKEIMNNQNPEILKPIQIRKNSEQAPKPPTDRSNYSDEITLGGKASSTYKLDDNLIKDDIMNNSGKRDDPLLLNLDASDQVLGGRIYRKISRGGISGTSSSDYMKFQAGQKYTDTEYENNTEDLGETYREREGTIQEDPRVKDKDYTSITSRTDEDNSHIKQLRELMKNLENMNL